MFKMKWKPDASRTTREYIALFSVIIAIGSCFFLMLYSDNLVNSDFGYQLCSSIFEGSFKQFFNEFDWSYGVVIYAIYAIWSIPVWMIHHIIGISIDLQAIPVLLWYKTLLAVFAGWSEYLVKKIAEIYEDETIDISLLYISSQLFVIPIFAIAQCDIMGLCFVLLGVYYYMQDKKIPFLISFFIAMNMKYFALFIFIPLILLENKQIKHIISVGIGTMIYLIAGRWVVSLSDRVQAVTGDESYYVNVQIKRFTDVSLEIGMPYKIGLWIFFYFILCVMAYLVPKTEKRKWTMWFALTGYMLFFLFYPCNVYWYVLLTPFFILVFLQKKELLHINLILELLFSGCVLVQNAFTGDWVFPGGGIFSYLFLKEYSHAMQENALIYYIEKIMGTRFQDFLPMLIGILYACGVLMIIINCPLFSGKTDKGIKYEEINFVQNIRIFILYFWILISVLCLIDSQNEYYFDGYTQIDFDESQIVQNNKRCSFVGHYIGEKNGAWLGNNYEIIMHNTGNSLEPIEIFFAGFSDCKEVKVYIDSDYYGILELNDNGLYIDIDKDIFCETKDYHIVFKADDCTDDLLMFCDYIDVVQIK